MSCIMSAQSPLAAGSAPKARKMSREILARKCRLSRGTAGTLRPETPTPPWLVHHVPRCWPAMERHSVKEVLECMEGLLTNFEFFYS